MRRVPILASESEETVVCAHCNQSDTNLPAHERGPHRRLEGEEAKPHSCNGRVALAGAAFVFSDGRFGERIYVFPSHQPLKRKALISGC